VELGNVGDQRGGVAYLETVLAGPAAWNATSTISRAIEIRDGAVLNPSILSFQHRHEAYPYAVRADHIAQLAEGCEQLGGS
jgi:hypothetical protein